MDQQDLATLAANIPATRQQFSLDNMALLAEEYRQRRRRMAEDKDWCDQFVEALKAMAGKDTEEFTLRGKVVAKLVPGQLNVSRIAKELPDIHAQYYRMVVKQEFDKKAFEQDEPELFETYRARRFCPTEE